MARSRYRFGEPEQLHFLTATVLEWLPVFTRREKRYTAELYNGSKKFGMEKK